MIIKFVIFLVGILFGILLVTITTKRMGILKIDMTSNEETDIARFIFDIPLEKLSEHEGLYFIKVEKSSGLKSIK